VRRPVEVHPDPAFGWFLRCLGRRRRGLAGLRHARRRGHHHGDRGQRPERPRPRVASRVVSHISSVCPRGCACTLPGAVLPVAVRMTVAHPVPMKVSCIALIVAAGCAELLGAACSNTVADPCTCPSCSHPYGACPGETLPNWCPGESDGSQPCPCPNPGAMAAVGGCSYVCAQDGKWSPENDAGCLIVDAGDATRQENSD
jgi:hypothetical protein